MAVNSRPTLRKTSIAARTTSLVKVRKFRPHTLSTFQRRERASFTIEVRAREMCFSLSAAPNYSLNASLLALKMLRWLCGVQSTTICNRNNCGGKMLMARIECRLEKHALQSFNPKIWFFVVRERNGIFAGPDRALRRSFTFLASRLSH